MEKRNLSLDTVVVVVWCQDKVNLAHANITRREKNWYVILDNFVITVNARRYNIIMVYMEKI